MNTTNFLSPLGYQLSIANLPNVGFYAQQVNLPGVTLPDAVQSTRFTDIPHPGDKLQWDPFSINFMIDTNMDNYMAIWNWLITLGFPDNDSQFDKTKVSSDGFLQILNTTGVVRTIKFKDLIPTNLQTIQFQSTDADVNYIQGSVEFLYTSYEIV